MTRIVICGACGKMGRFINDVIKGRDDCEVLAGVDKLGEAYDSFPVVKSVKELSEKPDVIIDFSHPSALGELLEYGLTTGTPLVLATTGYSEDELSQIHKAAEQVPVFFTFNMTLGINLMAELAKKAAKVLGGQYDIEIIEKHHNQKIDAPSGTAIALADAVNAGLEEPYEYVYDRSGRREKRPKAEIGISAVRGGSIVGDHDVLFAGQDEVITFSHRVYSRAVFGKGAVEAAKFLAGKAPGYYDMQDVLR